MLQSTKNTISKTSDILYIDGSSEPNDINQGRKSWPIPEEKPIRAGLYYVIPAEVMEDDRLDCSEKILYAIISGLAHNDGYCYASNKHFAERMKCKEREIQNKLEKLEKSGYIERNVKKVGMYWDRKIFVCHSRISKNVYETHSGAPSTRTTLHLRDAPQCTKVSEVLVSEDKTPPIVPLKVDECVFFGKFVKLKKTEHDALVKEYSEKSVEDMIAQMNDHFAATGKKPYKDFAAALRNWFRRRLTGPNSVTKTISNIDADKALAEKIKTKYPNHPNIVVGYNYIEFMMNRIGVPDPHLVFGDNGFAEQVENNIRKMGMKI